MRKHTLKILDALGGASGRPVTDDDIVRWANATVQQSGKSTSMRNFRDSSLSTGVFLVDLCAAIEPRAVNWELVTPGANEEDKINNAKYAISIARKIGACVFLTPDDITEVKSKMIMTFVASLWATSLGLEGEEKK
jgi:plastin-1